MMHLWEPQLFLLNLKLLHQNPNLQAIHRQERFGRRNMAIGMTKTETPIFLTILLFQGIENKNKLWL
jgi:hypothetical protein